MEEVIQKLQQPATAQQMQVFDIPSYTLKHADLTSSAAPSTWPVPETWSQVLKMEEAAIDAVLRTLKVKESTIVYEAIADKRHVLWSTLGKSQPRWG